MYVKMVDDCRICEIISNNICHWTLFSQLLHPFNIRILCNDIGTDIHTNCAPHTTNDAWFQRRHLIFESLAENEITSMYGNHKEQSFVNVQLIFI